MSGTERQKIRVAPAPRTPVTLLLWLIPALFLGVAALPDPETPAGINILLLGVAAGVSALFFLAPRRLTYALTTDTLEVTHVSATSVWPLRGMRVRRSAGHLTWRKFGTGLPGYLSGTYSIAGDEALKITGAYASRPDRGVLVEAGGEPYFLTPADPEAFLAELARRGAQMSA